MYYYHPNEVRNPYPVFLHYLYSPYYRQMNPDVVCDPVTGICGAQGSSASSPTTTKQPSIPIGAPSPKPVTPIYTPPQQSQPIFQPPTQPMPIFQSPTQSQPIFQPPTQQQPIYKPPVQQQPIYKPPTQSIPSTPQPPSSSKEVEEFVHNGVRYRCQWVYCCSPIEQGSIPEKLEPGINQKAQDYMIWEEDEFPEFKIGACTSINNCIQKRNSTLRVIFRIIYPASVQEVIEKELRECFEIGSAAASAAVATQIAIVRAAPESAPAILPNMLNLAYEAGKEAFIECLKQKQNAKYYLKYIKYSVFHEQFSNEGWHTLNSKDVVRMLEQLYLYQTGLILLPGVDSFADLGKKLGVDEKGIENFFKEPVGTINKQWDKLGDALPDAKIGGTTGEILKKIGFP